MDILVNETGNTGKCSVGIEEPLVYEHMRDIESYVRMVSENAVTSWNQVF